jgi:hypothetical protein
MMEQAWGGFALGGPRVVEDEDDEGMSLRDYFAAKAMQSIMLDKQFLLRDDAQTVADRAYEYADSMLRERVK